MEKKIKSGTVGSVYRVKHNGMQFFVTITDDPSQYQFYTKLGLDVFEYVPRANVEVKKVNDSIKQGNGKHKRIGKANG